jgi:DNA methyltransferase 1-associated protein 1
MSATERARKPEGMSRELYSLIGTSAPTLVAQLAKPRLKQKPNLGGRVKWWASSPGVIFVQWS